MRHKSSVATGCAGCGKPGGSIKEVTKALRTAHTIYSFALPRRTWDVWSCEKKPEKKLSSAKRTHGATGIADCFFSFFFCLLLISFNSRHKLSWWRRPSLRLHWEAFPFCLLPEKGMPDHVLSWYGLTSPLYAWSAVFSFLLWVYSLGGRRGRFFFFRKECFALSLGPSCFEAQSTIQQIIRYPLDHWIIENKSLHYPPNRQLFNG